MFEECLKKNVSASDRIAYLQVRLTHIQREIEKYGIEDTFVSMHLEHLIACKEMVEALIGAPVNLQQDGKVTIGF